MGVKKESIKSDLKRIDRIKDGDIDYSDIPPTTKEFWRKARVVMPAGKVHLSVRFDEDIVKWFKRNGPGYQSRMNAVLRAFVNAHKRQV